MRKNLIAFGSICMTEPCSFCGGVPKRRFPRMCVHVGVDTTQFEIVPVREDRSSARREKKALKDRRVMFVVCVGCAERLSNKLDQAIEQAHAYRAKFFQRSQHGTTNGSERDS